MLWRLWAFFSSAPLGVLAALALPRSVTDAGLAAAAAAGGAIGVALASLAARFGDDAPDRSAHVARGASAGLVALPALLAALARLGPPAWVWLGLAVLALGLALWRASRAQTPGPGARGIALAALAALLAGAFGVASIAFVHGFLPVGSPPADANLRAAIFDIDSRVALRPRASCAPRVGALAVVAERGGAPRLGADESIWFEARDDDGRFQIHRAARGRSAALLDLPRARQQPEARAAPRRRERAVRQRPLRELAPPERHRGDARERAREGRTAASCAPPHASTGPGRSRVLRSERRGLRLE